MIEAQTRAEARVPLTGADPAPRGPAGEGGADAAAATVGCLLGTAIGDALGLPYEGLGPRRAARLLGPPDRYRLLGPWGLVSDDTEHTCLVARALIVSGAEPAPFAAALARGLRLWLLGLPAGIGWATLRALLRLWAGLGPARSGVASAGNGPAMRAAIIGAAVADEDRLCALVRVATRITHTDPRAEAGALAVALAARLAAAGGPVDPETYLARLRAALGRADPGLGVPAQGLVARIAAAAASAGRGEGTEAFAAAQGLGGGVSGFVEHTVPVALHAWLRHPGDFGAAVQAVIRCGGDTDTTAAIVGGILGAGVGKAGLPPAWLDRLAEWPRSVAWMEALGRELAGAGPAADRGCLSGVRFVAGVALRNLLFMLVVLGHGLRRLLPPY